MYHGHHVDLPSQNKTNFIAIAAVVCHRAGVPQIELVDRAETNRQVYVVVKREILDEAKEALRIHRNVAAIQQGIDASDAGQIQPAREALGALGERLASRHQA